MRMKKARFDRAAYLNQQPLNEQLPGRSTCYLSIKPRIRRRVRESESGAGRWEIQKSRV